MAIGQLQFGLAQFCLRRWRAARCLGVRDPHVRLRCSGEARSHCTSSGEFPGRVTKGAPLSHRTMATGESLIERELADFVRNSCWIYCAAVQCGSYSVESSKERRERIPAIARCRRALQKARSALRYIFAENYRSWWANGSIGRVDWRRTTFQFCL
jgi:hypothetical protein